MRMLWTSVLLAVLLALHGACSQSQDANVQTLLKAQQSAKDGVIKLNSDTFSKYVKGKQRPFSLFMFLTASHLKSQTGNGLEDMRKDFGYLGKALKDKIAKGEISPGKVFLAEADFIDSQELFRRFNTQTLPFSFILPADFSIDREVIKLRSEDQLRADSYDKFPWTSEEFGSFLTDRTSVNVGRVVRPSFMTSPLFPFVAIASLLSFGVVGFRLYYAPFMKNLIIWSVGTLAVYWFSVSGGMHNIIRGMPLYALTPQGAQFFMPPGQGQLGAEGFLCGTGYLTVGLAVTAVTLLPKYMTGLEEKKRRWISYGAIGVGAWSFLQVVALYKWKTNNQYRTYF